MNLFQRNFEQVWDQLRSKKTGYTEFLEEIRIQHLRGIQDLTIRFEFPVSVIAGPNGCGKSTALFAIACAYQVPGASNRDFVPTTLFPNLRAKHHDIFTDKLPNTIFEYFYIHENSRKSMRWAKGKSWNRSFMGLAGGKQPVRALYLRTLSNLNSPSEVRSVLQLGNSEYETEEITADLIAFAHRVLPFRYDSLSLLKKGDKNLLFAVRNEGEASTQYSEFHMSAGERTILRISKDISRLQKALILIDELEVGLHPYTQQQFMLELHRLALRNELQIIVTSHSPTVLNCVPREARIFLERTQSNVVVRSPYQDILQKAFYGQSIEKLSILCEDVIAEHLLLGVLDHLNPKLGLIHEDIVVGRDTGKDQFAQHIEALGKFRQLDSFIFVLDGDAKSIESKLKTLASEKFGYSLSPLFLPGEIPESWAWKQLQAFPKDYAEALGITPEDFIRNLNHVEHIFRGATDKPANIAKNQFEAFADLFKLTKEVLIRLIGRIEAVRQQGEFVSFVQDLEDQIRRWQSR